MGLTWWAVNGETIQITTVEAGKEIERVEFYDIPPSLHTGFASSDGLIEALRKQIGTGRGGKGQSATSAHLQLDEPSGRLIVVADPDTHRFLSARLSPAK
jgi:hypothetical protein